MNLRTFIERPVFSAVISITIVILGIIGLFTLPVEQYPDIAPPTIMVSTTYYGASAETLQKSVIAPLEEAINGVEDMTYMTSTASNAGSVSITVYFKQGTDPDMAAVNVQNRVSKATGQLPAEVTQVGVTTSKRQTSILQMFSLYSPDDSYDENFLANYISINLKPQILRISGVGDMMIMGGDYSMRIWMKPDVMAQYKLIPSDVTAVLAEQNIESATGSFGENSDETYQYTMKYTGRLITPEEFGDIVIRSTEDGEVLKLKDIADIELGKDSYAYKGTMDGHPGISCMVFQTAVNKSFAKYISEFNDIPESLKDERIDEVDRTPAENLAYQVGWTALILKWEADERKGIQVKTPSDNFKWNQLGELYQWFTDTYAHLSLQELKDMLNENINSIYAMIDSLSEEELFKPHMRKWADEATKTAVWEVYKFIHVNTVAPFGTFRTKIRKWKKIAL